jgi:hypothetical protein
MLYGREILSQYMAGLRKRRFSGRLYDPPVLFGGTVYHKGAWVLHMLRRLISDDVFFTTLRKYIDDYSYGNVTTEIFQRVCEDVSGQDLQWFFDQWVYDDEIPRLLYDWEAEPVPGGYDIELVIKQEQTGDRVFRMPLDIRADGPGVERSWTVVDSLPSQLFTLGIDFEPDNLVIDPEGWALAYFRRIRGMEAFDADRFTAGIILENPYPNPFNSSVTIPLSLLERVDLTLDLYNIVGERVAEIHRGEIGPGIHRLTWDGQDRSGKAAPSGLYFAVLSLPGRNLVRKVVLLR